MRPFHVLSNGEQFRVNVARTLAESPGLSVIDEFTSVIDRTVAKIGSAAVAKTVRRRKQKFVAVTCHYDVLDWLQPDWVYEPHTGKLERGLVRQRPPIQLEIARVHHSAWELFKQHHYLTAKAHKAAACFVAFLDGRPVAFDAWLPFLGRLKDSRRARRGHRTVCLPDYQGVGIGNALFCHIASMWAGLGYRAFSCTGHPAEMSNRVKSGLWRMTRKPSRVARDSGRGLPEKTRQAMRACRSFERITASFEWIGPKMNAADAARLLGC